MTIVAVAQVSNAQQKTIDRDASKPVFVPPVIVKEKNLKKFTPPVIVMDKQQKPRNKKERASEVYTARI